VRIATIALVSLFLACAGNGSGISLTTPPDAAWGEEVAAPAPDVQASVDTLVIPGPEAQPDTRPAPDVGVAMGPEVSLDTLPPVQADVQISVDALPAQPDTMRALGPEAGREAGPEVAQLSSFTSCTYRAVRVEVAKQGVYCGQYPQIGPQGGIVCYTGCTVESTMTDLGTLTNVSGTPPIDVPPTVDCMSVIDDFATSGSTNSRAGLCFQTTATCATVCPSQ
jgi:hypothetical protein